MKNLPILQDFQSYFDFYIVLVEIKICQPFF